MDDGAVYSAAGIPLAKSNVFLEIGSGGMLFIKVPTRHCFREVRYFVERPEDLRNWNIRSPLEAEQFDRMDDGLAVPAFSLLRRLRTLKREDIYLLLLFMMQYRRLCAQTAVSVPQARFGALRQRRLGFLHHDTPALFQERIPGTTLWDMFDFDADMLRPEWKEHLPPIKAQLGALIHSPHAPHIDWNIKNFVFNPSSRKLFYIDQKPTLFVAGHGNELNLTGIRHHFLA